MTPQEAIKDLLETRGNDKTICPSEAAKLLARDKDDWRPEMERVHSAVDEMLAAGAITISWQGQRKEQRRGPYRIARR